MSEGMPEAAVEENEKEINFENASLKIKERGFQFHVAEHDSEGKNPKTFHTSEHPRTLERRAEQMADVLHLSPKQRLVAEMAIAWHDTVIEYDETDPNNLLAMIRRHRGAREGDAPFSADGNEGKSARLVEDEMRKANEEAGVEIFTEEDIRAAILGVDFTYPDANLGKDFKGAPFEECPYFGVAVEQNPELGKLFAELKKGDVVKGPLFSQPHLEKALEDGVPVPKEALIVALADLGAAGFSKNEEFFHEGDDEMRELYGNLRRQEVLSRLVVGDDEADRVGREKAMGAFTGWLNGQPGFAAWQALRFEKILHLLKQQNAITVEEETGLRGQFSHYGENIRASLARAKELTARVEEIKSSAGEKEAFKYLAETMGYTIENKEGENEVVY